MEYIISNGINKELCNEKPGSLSLGDGVDA